MEESDYPPNRKILKKIILFQYHLTSKIFVFLDGNIANSNEHNGYALKNYISSQNESNATKADCYDLMDGSDAGETQNGNQTGGVYYEF